MAHHQPPPKRGKTLFSFFKKKYGIPDDQQNAAAQTSILNLRTSETVVVESSIPNVHTIDTTSFQQDPGLRIPINDYPVNQRDEIRRKYLNAGPFQPKLSEYPGTEVGDQHRRFQYVWYKQFSRLEYSPSK
ncbi:uncharacterized protein LOC120011760 [Tripterygium wilfordii]|uniref:uncharacterized protein LOC120011760 n=1 Tax=Tripterygium wilfordii TaxID=458696 RepID=UPI0018F8625F|nr:uncharacterized protein LOC120011760 [Tripterygium wilfordii]